MSCEIVSKAADKSSSTSITPCKMHVLIISCIHLKLQKIWKIICHNADLAENASCSMFNSNGIYCIVRILSYFLKNRQWLILNKANNGQDSSSMCLLSLAILLVKFHFREKKVVGSKFNYPLSPPWWPLLVVQKKLFDMLSHLQIQFWICTYYSVSLLKVWLLQLRSFPFLLRIISGKL